VSGSFDPYHKWLGIPLHQQPANYYRLLGVEPFEEDTDVIAGAADRLLKYVRDVGMREQPELAKMLLDELLVARVCLLTVEQKQAYDAGLRSDQVAPEPPPFKESVPRNGPLAETGSLSKQPQPSSINKSSASAQVTSSTSKRPIRNSTTTVKKARPRVVWLASVVMLGLVIGGVLFTQSGKKRSKPLAVSSVSSVEPKLVDRSPKQLAGASTESTEATVEIVVDEQSDPTIEIALPEFKSDASLSELLDEDDATLADPTEEESVVIATDDVSEELPVTDTSEDVAMPVTRVSDRESIGRGGLLREIWIDVKGNQVEAFVEYVADVPTPDQSETVDHFATPDDFGDNYGQRLRGYLHPPMTGTYEFSVRANAEGWLYISTDSSPKNKRRVEPGIEIELRAGDVYYVEAYHKESSGRDYLHVGWSLPDGSEETPIPGERLSVGIAPQHATEFVVLAPLSAESSSGRNLKVLDDGEVLVDDSVNENETYHLMFESEIETITAIRLEAIPDETLPKLGPGLGAGGRFALVELSVTFKSASEKSVRFSSAVDERGRDLGRIIDGNESSVWRVAGRGKRATATCIVAEPQSVRGGTAFEIVLQQREGLGCFRLLATSATEPLSLLRGTPPASNSDTFYLLHANLGGGDFTTPDGVHWRASKRFDNKTFGHEGGRGVSEDLIANKVQGTALRGVSAFRATVPDGTYEVTLFFCEYWSSKPSSRQFAIAAEQQVVTPNFNLLQAAGGMAKPFVYPIRDVEVTDGRLDLQFRETSENSSTMLNAVSIRQVR
jgi:Malectin domain/PA14 domain